MSNTDNSHKSDAAEQKNDPQDLGRPVGQQDHSAQNSEHIPQQNSEKEPLAAAPVVRPWYASPWFWSFMLFLGVLALLAWLFWLQWQAYMTQSSKEDALFLAQEARNKELEAHLAYLQKFLVYDPCVLKDMLEKEGILLVLPTANEGKAPSAIPSGTPLQIPSHLVPPSTNTTPPPSPPPAGQTTPSIGKQNDALPAPPPAVSPSVKNSGTVLAPSNPPAASTGQSPAKQSPLFPPTEAEAPPPPPLPTSYAPEALPTRGKNSEMMTAMHITVGKE